MCHWDGPDLGNRMGAGGAKAMSMPLPGPQSELEVAPHPEHFLVPQPGDFAHLTALSPGDSEQANQDTGATKPVKSCCSPAQAQRPKHIHHCFAFCSH